MQRRHDLDWVRVCAFGLLVLYHVGMYYVTWDWHVKSPAASDALEPFMMLSSPWRLSLLFLGVRHGHRFPARQGPERSRRRRHAHGFPRPALMAVAGATGLRDARDRAPAGVLRTARFAISRWLPRRLPRVLGRYLAADGSFCDDDGCLRLPTWNHLWFVAYLWVYTVLIWALTRCAPAAVQRMSDRLAAVLASNLGILLWPALFFASARIALIGTFGSTHALIDDGYNHVQYFGIFLLGFLVARCDAVWSAFVRVRWAALALWLISWASIVLYFSAFADVEPPQWLRIVMRGAWGLNQWCAIAAILGFARRWNPGDSRALRYLSQAVFPVYILHQTIIVLLAYNAQRFELPPLLEGPALVVLTLGLCFAGYEVVRRVPPLRPLFGLKRNAPTTHPSATRDPQPS